MASGIFAILDDIAALMDDVALATKKTAGILGDDLAVNAEKATGFLASREIPVLWKITKGSFLNKLIIIPIVFLLEVFFPIAITAILIIGGLYLAYEGFEKVVHYFKPHPEHTAQEVIQELSAEQAENTKVKAAITTDFILSVEIVIIALSTVMEEPLMFQIITVSIVAFLATVGVYGIVALIVRMDDAGFKLIKRSKGQGFWNWLGDKLVKALPKVIRMLGIIGTIALFLVSGGILDHSLPFLHHQLEAVPEMLKQFIYGVGSGAIVFVVLLGFTSAIKLIKAK